MTAPDLNDLTPDLNAAYRAARNVVAEQLRQAAMNLVPCSYPRSTGGGHLHVGPHPDQAIESAREAQAAQYEASALYREGRRSA